MAQNKHPILYIAAIVSLGGFLFGFDASVISGVVRFIVPQFGLNDWQTGLVNSLSSFLVQVIFPWELSNLGGATIFFIYSALGAIGFVLLAWLLPETRGRPLEQLEIDLSRGHKT